MDIIDDPDDLFQKVYKDEAVAVDLDSLETLKEVLGRLALQGGTSSRRAQLW